MGGDGGNWLNGSGQPGYPLRFPLQEPPEAEEVYRLAERVSAWADALDESRGRLLAVGKADWESSAATAFRVALADSGCDMAAVAGELRAASDLVRMYGALVFSAANQCVAPATVPPWRR